MREKYLRFLVCPDCHKNLVLENAEWEKDEIKSGLLTCQLCVKSYPIRAFIPRFVPSDIYADAFSIEWTTFRKAHLDSYTGLNRLDKEYRSFLDFPITALKDKIVLDAGCGLGRYSEIVLNYGGEVMAADLSFAIDAAFENLNHRGNICFVQADIFNLPFRPETFDLIYSTGVLHHTPNPPDAFQHLPPLLKPGGKLMTMVYAKYNKAYLTMVEFYRKFAKRLPKRWLLKLCYIAVPMYYLSKIPAIGPFVTRILLPVSVNPPNHSWRVGNTFDLYSPDYAFYYNHVEVYDWYERAGLTNIKPVGPESGVCFIATKPPVGQIVFK